MNKILKSILSLGVCGAVMITAGCSGCDKKTQLNDPETRPLKLSTGALDGNFNPFFYTAQNDGNMLANTQIAMLTTDESGQVVCGNNQPTAVLDYRSTNTPDSNAKGSITTYEFVIKNGIKFSDGVDLTIADVLFNLYVYLDPAYTGSSTIYSTDIQGLKAYRTQNPTLDDFSDDNGMENDYYTKARNRIDALIDWASERGKESELTDKQKADLASVKSAFEKELDTDWTNTVSSYAEAYKDTYRFTSAWQAYFYEHGEVEDQVILNTTGSKTRIYEDTNGNEKRDDGELYYTTLDPWQPRAEGIEQEGVISRKGQELFQLIADATTDSKVNEYMTANGVSDRDYAIEQLQKEACINQVKDTYLDTERDSTKIANILTYWATATTIQEQFVNEERAAHFEEVKQANGGKLAVTSIKGIKTSKKAGSDLQSGFHGKMNESFSASEDYSVLTIVINGVDPKAIFNFAFTVAPLHYYSGTYEGIDYVAEAMEGKEGSYGVKLGDPKFYEAVLKDPDKVGLPVGAGPYMAADFNGDPTKDKNKFKDGTIVTFVRNEQFTTLGTGIENAKIKKVQYKVLQDDAIMTNLVAESIDFGMPNATPTNRGELGKNTSLGERSYLTGGYGYVGINPKFVPEYKVRQAIMKAMYTESTLRYYGSDLASPVYRPMSKTSWAYPDGATSYYPYTAEDKEITKLVEEAGYTRENGGIYKKTRNVNGMSNAPIGTELKFNFIIAGETTNHPAYLMFTDARERLNQIGFDITVKTDVNALKNLATGNLGIWAAAWSSSIDPDPYQIYHKDSNASSVLNWNYKNILNDQTKWRYEYQIIAGNGGANGEGKSLSDWIDAGRATENRDDRKTIYAKCLTLIMDLAVELPTYQRNDMCVYNTKYIDASTLVQNPSYNMGLFDRLWEINYV